MVAVDQGWKTQNRVIGVQDDWVERGVFNDLCEFLHFAVFKVQLDHLGAGQYGFLVEWFEIDFGGCQGGVGERALNR